MNRHTMRRLLRLSWPLLAACKLAMAQVPADPYNYSRTSAFTYDPATGFVATQTIEPDNAASCVLLTFGYDAYGNGKSVTAANCAGAPGSALFASRQSSFDFSAPASETIVVGGSNVTVNYPAGLFATTAVDAVGHSTTLHYDPRFGVTTSTTDANALAESVAYDDFGRKTKQTRPDGTSTVWLYCILPGTKPNGSPRETASNSAACPSPASGEAPADAVGFEQAEDRDIGGAKMGPFVRTYRDRLDRVIRTVTESFDGSNQTAGRSAALIVSDTVYNAFGAKVLQSAPYFLASGSSATSGTNDAGATMAAYDALGRPTVIYRADEHGQAGLQTFGSGGNVAYGAYGTQKAAQTRFDYAATKRTVTDDRGQVRTEESNALGEPVRITDAAGATLIHQRDAFGNLVASRDALGNTIAMSYDLRGRKVQLNGPDAGIWLYCYDALGQLVAQQNAAMRGASAPGACPAAPNSGAAVDASKPNRGASASLIANWATFAYDQLGQLVQRAEPEYVSTWVFDQYADGTPCNKGKGRLCESKTSSGVDRRVAYDSLGRAIQSRTDTGTGPSFATAVAYDAVTGRVSTLTYPTGLQVGYRYTPRGFVEKLTLETAATVQPLPSTPGGSPGPSTSLTAGSVLWQARAMNAWNALEQQGYGNGVVAQMKYEPLGGRLSDVTAGVGASTTVLNHHYAWDSVDNLVGRSDANGDGTTGAVSEVFSYDANANRLVSYTVSGPSIPGLSRTVNLQYNALGMLLYKSDVGVYAYGSQGGGAARPHALLSVTGASTTTNSYDSNGNLTAASQGKYRGLAYTSFNLPDGSLGVNGAGGSPRYTWAYDEEHARIRQTRTITGGAQAGTRTTWYLHPDNEGGLGFESEVNSPTTPSASNPAAKSQRHFLSVGGQAVGVLVSTGDLPSLGAGQLAPAALGSITLAKVEYWHTDVLGSVAATTDHAAAVTRRYAYDPFGKRRDANGSYDEYGNVVADWSPAVNAGTARGFTQHEQQDDVGLVHMNGRLFDPQMAMFLQADPYVSEPFDLRSYNRYAYCLQNPLNCRDPSGYNNDYVLPKDPQNLWAAGGGGVGANGNGLKSSWDIAWSRGSSGYYAGNTPLTTGTVTLAFNGMACWCPEGGQCIVLNTGHRDLANTNAQNWLMSQSAGGGGRSYGVQGSGGGTNAGTQLATTGTGNAPKGAKGGELPKELYNKIQAANQAFDLCRSAKCEIGMLPQLLALRGAARSAGVSSYDSVLMGLNAEVARASFESGNTGQALQTTGVLLIAARANEAGNAGAWKGAGPIPGTFGVAPWTESAKGLLNFFPRRGNVEFIFDPVTSTFVVGNGTMKHAALASSIGADTSRVVGGIFSRGANGTLLTNEASGHFWQNWNPQVRQQFVDFMNSKGLSLIHREGM